MIGKMQGASKPIGVVLSAATDFVGSHGEEAFALLLVDADSVVLAQLGPYFDDEVVAIWRAVASRSSLVRMIVCDDGRLHAVSHQLGRVALGTTHRRRHSVLSGRRPRFLAQRVIGSQAFARPNGFGDSPEG
ncbi:DUF6101 family protein [uncultured Methylobacterium sp.]|uniref:DUF6101 family protein n=1 Tax=uncultured Methylobacterium sp. TaxID=157278 RepID=UPI0035CBB76A